MLIILMIFLIVSSIFVLIVKQNKETFYIFSMNSSLTILIIGMMLYIAKKGGISDKLQEFYFFNSVIKAYVQYFYVTLDTLGYMVAIGRYLFPVFLLLLALHYSNVDWLKKHKWFIKASFSLPFISLIFSFPPVFHNFTNTFESFRVFLINFSFAWILLYVFISITLLVIEAFAVQIKFFKRRFALIILFVISIIFLYLLYFGQDPIQIYLFYFSGNGIYYMDATLSISAYISIIIINIAFSIIGFTSLIKYTKDMFNKNKEEFTMQRNNKMMTAGASIFVHSMKNQLLANRVIFKRLHTELDNNEEINSTVVNTHIEQLRHQNEVILERIDDLNQSVKSKTVHLAPTLVEDILYVSIQKFHEKYPNENIQLITTENSEIRADEPLLSEALYNLLINAQEAIDAKEIESKKPITVKNYESRKYVTIEIRDQGIGIEKGKIKKIMEPFYSTKNSNFNWGVGLYYVRSIIKEHFGMFRLESSKGEGTTIFLYLPRLK